MFVLVSCAACVRPLRFFQDGLTGSAWGDWANYTDSPLRAFEGELGVQPPAGFWDPLGFTKTDDAASFRRRRYVELKHGRAPRATSCGSDRLLKVRGAGRASSKYSFGDKTINIKKNRYMIP